MAGGLCVPGQDSPDVGGQGNEQGRAIARTAASGLQGRWGVSTAAGLGGGIATGAATTTAVVVVPLADLVMDSPSKRFIHF
jgi:hypothetical protein